MMNMVIVDLRMIADSIVAVRMRVIRTTRKICKRLLELKVVPLLPQTSLGTKPALTGLMP